MTIVAAQRRLMTKAGLAEVRRDASHPETKHLSSIFLRAQTVSAHRPPGSVILLRSAVRSTRSSPSRSHGGVARSPFARPSAPSPCGSYAESPAEQLRRVSLASYLPDSQRVDARLATARTLGSGPSYGAPRPGDTEVSFAPDEPQSPLANTPSGAMMKSIAQKTR